MSNWFEKNLLLLLSKLKVANEEIISILPTCFPKFVSTPHKASSNSFSTPNCFSILVNNSNEGNIEFQDQMQIGVGSYPLSVATADLNMDYTPEIIVSNWNVEGLRVIHNFLPVDEQTDNLSYDINNDGVVNISDFAMLISFVIGGNDLVSAADINFDSEVDIFDLLLLSDYIQDL